MPTGTTCCRPVWPSHRRIPERDDRRAGDLGTHLSLSGYADYSGVRNHHLRVGLGHDDIDLYRTREYRNFNYASQRHADSAAGRD
jgi:hypothetical protein